MECDEEGGEVFAGLVIYLFFVALYFLESTSLQRDDMATGWETRAVRSIAWSAAMS